jgi:murein DD-endopeptidase MepM/ murein hydrolase activator NlpD
MTSGNKLKPIASRLLLIIGALLLTGCKQEFPTNPDYISDGFDFPVGKPNSKGYYDAQPFGKNNHLGSDWNGDGGGNTDLGKPVFAISNGYIHSAKNLGGGWGNVIRIIHQLPNGKQVESLYAHCKKILVKPNTWVKKGEKIGTMGSCNGRYIAHLHFEIRSFINMKIGGGYSWFSLGYLNPTKFIKANREVSK